MDYVQDTSKWKFEDEYKNREVSKGNSQVVY